MSRCLSTEAASEPAGFPSHRPVTLHGMKSIVTVSGPREVGPGEREVMLSRAQDVFAQLEVEEISRVDVPPKGTPDDSDGVLRTAVEPAVPALQSGSLFGGRSGLLVVDAQSLLKAEATVLSEVVSLADPEVSMPSRCAKVLSFAGSAIPKGVSPAAVAHKVLIV